MSRAGVSASSLSASLQLILRDFGEGLLKLAKQGEEGKEQAVRSNILLGCILCAVPSTAPPFTGQTLPDTNLTEPVELCMAATAAAHHPASLALTTLNAPHSFPGLQLQELAGHLNSKLLPGRAALKGKVCLEIAALSLVHSSGPAQGPAQGAHTLAIVPLLFPKARWMAALDTMFDPGG